MGPLKTRTRGNGAANKGGVAERGPERSEDRQCPLRFGVAAARFRRSTATDSGGETGPLRRQSATDGGAANSQVR